MWVYFWRGHGDWKGKDTDQIFPSLAFMPQKKEKLCSRSFELARLKGTTSVEWQWLGDTLNDPNMHIPPWKKPSKGRDRPAALFQLTLCGFASVVWDLEHFLKECIDFNLSGWGRWRVRQACGWSRGLYMTCDHTESTYYDRDIKNV